MIIELIKSRRNIGKPGDVVEVADGIGAQLISARAARAITVSAEEATHADQTDNKENETSGGEDTEELHPKVFEEDE